MRNCDVIIPDPDITARYYLIIPENDIIPEEGYFSGNEVVALLRKYCNNPKAVYFIADMMED